MTPKVVHLKVVRPYIIEVRFEDGLDRQIDLEADLWGPVFEPLRDPELFAQARIDPEWGTVTWPTGADLAPEFLYEGAKEPITRVE